MSTTTQTQPATGPAEWGEKGAYYVLNDESIWLGRCVESVTFTEDSARRQLTLDVTLPTDPAAVVQEISPEESVFCLPVSKLARSPRVSWFHLRDENGNALSLLTPEESELVSLLALMYATKSFLGKSMSMALYNSLVALPRATNGRAAVLFEGRAELEKLKVDGRETTLSKLPGYEHLRRVAWDLNGQWLIWLPLRGRPGERKIVKLSYLIPSAALSPDWRPLKARTAKASEPERPSSAQASQEYHAEAESPIETRGFRRHVRPWLEAFGYVCPTDHAATTDSAAAVAHGPRAFVDQAMAAIGWMRLEFKVESPVVRERIDYHLQVIPPVGLDVRDLQLVQEDVTRQEEILFDEAKEPVPPSVSCLGEAAHLWVNAHTVKQHLRPTANLHLRAQRRGLLTQALVASLLVAGLLWAYNSKYGGEAVNPNTSSAQTAAAVLLVVPALLALFSNLQLREHRLTSRILAPLRGLMLCSAMLSGLAAAELAGVHVIGLDSPWSLYRWLAVGIAAFVSISFLTSFRPVESFMIKELNIVEDLSRHWARLALSTRTAIGIGLAIVTVVTVTLVAYVTEMEPVSEPTITAVLLGAVCVSALFLAGGVRRGLPPTAAVAGICVPLVGNSAGIGTATTLGFGSRTYSAGVLIAVVIMLVFGVWSLHSARRKTRRENAVRSGY